jgi:lysophospholipase L1-like esterase
MHDQSTGLFTIAQDSTTCPIVVLGSSTAAGVGPSSSDSTWVNRYRRALYSRDTRYPIINLGKGGYTTYHILPDDAEIPDNINISIDSSRNLSEALSYDPYAIIINMPSNDAANSFGVDQQLANFDLMRDAANAEGVETYICTTQPRNFNNSNQIMIQEDMRDTILSHYGTFVIDFWSGIADTMGWIQPIYDSGDGVHLNDAGHAILFERVMQKQLDTTICNDIISTIGSVEKLGPIDSRLYPNPFSDQLNLQLLLSQNAKVSVKLIDLLGRDYGEYTWDLLDGNHQLSFELPKAYFSNPQFLIAVIYIKMEDEVYIQQQKILRLP